MNKQSNKLKNNFPKQLFVLALFLSVTLISQAQLKVDADGHIGLATNTTATSYEVYVDGDMLVREILTIGINFEGAGLIFDENTYGAISILPYGGQKYNDIGASDNQIYRTYSKYIYANQVPVTSDKRLKENFREIETPLSKILKVQGLKYDFKNDMADSIKNEKVKKEIKGRNKNRLGIMAQDLEEIIPEAVVYDEENDKYYIDYNAITPVIIEAMKEQQLIIDDLQTEVANLKGNSKEKSATLDNTQINAEAQAATLNQNIPNPFSETTHIDMYIPVSVSQAKLYIYNMQGNQIDAFAINERQNTSLTIDGYTLNAGMYYYTLIADGKEVDTKKMILTK